MTAGLLLRLLGLLGQTLADWTGRLIHFQLGIAKVILGRLVILVLVLILVLELVLLIDLLPDTADFKAD